MEQSLSDTMGMLWVLLCAALVLFMQAGFCCLETGLVRSKNSINVAAKNLVDVLVAGFIFWLVGHGLMFGSSEGGWFGTSGFLFNEVSPQALTHFLFQFTFCGTAVTIVSGAVAERMRFGGYIASTVLTCLLIYPVTGHWVWGSEGVLARQGFIDFAGSTAVHGVGGMVALAAVLNLGPRIGRFSPDAPPIRGHQLPLATVGVLILWFGWMGFNGGSFGTFDARVPRVLVNTTLAAASGGLGACLFSMLIFKRPVVEQLLNGVIAGLVGVTACAHVLSPAGALLVGIVAAGVCLAVAELLNRLRVDDAVGAVSAHAGAGAWGTLAVALLGETGQPWRAQLLVQGLGVAVVYGYAFGVSFVGLWVMRRWMPLRVTPEQERMGLNHSEHAAGTQLDELLSDMQRHVQTGDLSTRVEVEPHTEVGLIAQQYNRVIERLEQDEKHLRAAYEQVEGMTQDLTAARDRAEKASAAKSDFLANISHEVRTPMTAICGYADMLNDEETDPSQRAELSGKIRNHASHLLHLLNDVLDLSKAEAGAMTLESIPVSPVQVVREAMDMVRPAASQKGLVFSMQTHHPVPDRILADPTRLRQVLLNLLANAIKFTDKGHIGVDLAHDEQAKGSRGELCIAVTDTGIGITPEAQAKLFQPFTQADETMTRRFGGTGLGLSICRTIVQRMGGRIELQSEPGRGSRFSVILPVQAVEPQPMAGPPAPQAPAGSVSLKGVTVLLVEDGVDNQRILSHVLRKAGAEVTLADNGRLGVEAVRARAFDVILMDMQMPEMDGYAATATLRSQGCRLPIVGLTAHVGSEQRQRCLDAGCDDFANKPIPPRQLVELVARYASVTATSRPSRAD